MVLDVFLQSEKRGALWLPAGLLSPTNLCSQFLGPVGLTSEASWGDSTSNQTVSLPPVSCDHIYGSQIDLFYPLCFGTQFTGAQSEEGLPSG